jgi:hypothetical protein
LNEQFPDSQSELYVHAAPLPLPFLLLPRALHTWNEQLPDAQSELYEQSAPFMSAFLLLPDLALHFLNEQLPDAQSELNEHAAPLPSCLPPALALAAATTTNASPTIEPTSQPLLCVRMIPLGRHVLASRTSFCVVSQA